MVGEAVMKGFVRFPAPAAVLLLIVNSTTFADQGLMGHWSCTHQNASHSLEFMSANQLRFDGEVINYLKMFGSILVEEDVGIVNYSVNQQQDDLAIVNPDGSITQCKRGRLAPNKPSTAQASSAGQAQPVPTPDRNESGIEYLVYKFAGRWDHYSGNRLTNRYFKPDGSYEDSYEAGFSGEFNDQYGFQTGNWGVYGTEQYVGRWYPVGTLHEGQIYITRSGGSEEVLEYKILFKNGQYYSADYYFNGDLYTVEYIYR